HDLVATGVPEQRAPQPLQRLRQGGKRRAVAQGARLPLHERQVMLPVVDDLIAIDAARVFGDDGLVGDDDDAIGIEPHADAMPGPGTRDRVAVPGTDTRLVLDTRAGTST